MTQLLCIAKEVEKLTGNNTQFNNTALANLTTGISEGVSNFTGKQQFFSKPFRRDV